MFHVKHIVFSQSRVIFDKKSIYINIIYKTWLSIKYVFYPLIHVVIPSFPLNMFYVEHWFVRFAEIYKWYTGNMLDSIDGCQKYEKRQLELRKLMNFDCI